MLVSYFLDMMNPGESPSLSAMSREVLAQLRQPLQHAQRVTRVIARRATPAAQPKVRGYPPQLCEVVTKYCVQNLSFEDVMRHVNLDLKKMCDIVPGLWVEFQRKAKHTGWVNFNEKFIRNVAGYCASSSSASNCDACRSAHLCRLVRTLRSHKNCQPCLLCPAGYDNI